VEKSLLSFFKKKLGWRTNEELEVTPVSSLNKLMAGRLSKYYQDLQLQES